MPSRAEIKPKVVAKIAAIAHEDPADVTEGKSLEDDLGMTTTVRRAMALPYNGIISEYAGGDPITMDEAGDLETVKESIDLVFHRARGD
jgi:hypothetical protein